MSNPYRDKLLSVGVLKGGVTRSQTVAEDNKDGVNRKHTTDEAGNTTIEWNNKEDRVDVEIHPKTHVVEMKMQQ